MILLPLRVVCFFSPIRMKTTRLERLILHMKITQKTKLIPTTSMKPKTKIKCTQTPKISPSFHTFSNTKISKCKNTYKEHDLCENDVNWDFFFANLRLFRHIFVDFVLLKSIKWRHSLTYLSSKNILLIKLRKID